MGALKGTSTQISKALASSKDYKKVTPEQAQQLANKGIFVVGAQAGHVATVRPEGVAGDNLYKGGSGTGQLINQIGADVYVSRANWAFRNVPAELYYAPAADVP